MAYRKIETYDEATTSGLAAAYKDILDLIGEDSNREGLLKTPERVAKAMQFLTQGQGHDPVEIIRGAIFTESVQEMVIVKDV
ncbi:MAG: GTP cyclohydrolase I, partial [Ilumatobacteraceae bacterium]